MTNEFLNDGRIIQNYRQTAQMKQGINTTNNAFGLSSKNKE
nr:hypothetical protein [uncultured Flavobacterium sp.]